MGHGSATAGLARAAAHTARSLGTDPRPHIEAVGISDDLVRLSVGLEDPDDIVEDLERALKASQR